MFFQRQIRFALGILCALLLSVPIPLWGSETLVAQPSSSSNATESMKADIQLGQRLYRKHCLMCHGKYGEGQFGPNLADNYWIYGNRTEDLVRVVTEGIPEKGMVRWKEKISSESIYNVVAFIETFQGTNPPNPKAPQGQEVLGQPTALTVALLDTPPAEKKPIGAISLPSGSSEQAPVDLQMGKVVYTKHCLMCHGKYGEGQFGPNLTDNFWIHGNTTQDLIRVISEGVAEKGMVSWKAKLSAQDIQNVVSFIESLQGTNPPRAKAPQGEEY